MSWAGLKKSVNRAGTLMLQKTSQVDKTVDAEFAEEDARYRTLEKETIALQKEAKAYLDSVRGLSAAQARIGETVAGFYTDSSEAAMAATAYKRATEELDGKCQRELDAPFRATILEPIGRLCSYFPEINKTIEKRNRKLLDYDAARTKHRKLVEKPSDDPSKAERELEDAKILFEQLNNQLLEELPQLIDLRIPYLDPSFEAMVRMQARFAEEGYEKMGGVQRFFAEGVREEYAEGQLDVQVEGVLQEMRELSICGMGN
ncbi:BAR adaptor protein Hob3 [Tilletia horrida]|uniref:BAR adaptor protein Hob3 n=1 Tax=Tilletia horrida TaxID=155126 RepID=A0AAN6GFQ6_9BASI|nr:BAR adaptor protein Hob3 [Tilletia horrida]KAK0530927.1 BAR adaptor protein Hob3 [Tilletia horrida]KAK0539081.1 BAR adaptor protein Hob3 [Tilletia horrida]KAK0545476.1 BAR adaptor protein Hob3 [Tilletia horrida]